MKSFTLSSQRKLPVMLLVAILIIMLLSLLAGCTTAYRMKSTSDNGEMYNKIINDYKNSTKPDTDNKLNIVHTDINIKIPNEKHKVFFRIPVLEYHCIDNTDFGVKDLFISPTEFEKQMKYLHDNGYTTITFRDIPKVASIKKPIMITFDDGYEDNFTSAYPILKKYEFKATIFLISSAIGKKFFLNTSEIKQMESIVDFQSHTVNHLQLAKLSHGKMEYELSQSKKLLEKITGTDVFCISYPFGSYNSDVLKTANKYYKYGVTTRHGEFLDTPGTEDLQIKRLDVANNTDLPKFIQEIGGKG